MLMGKEVGSSSGEETVIVTCDGHPVALRRSVLVNIGQQLRRIP